MTPLEFRNERRPRPASNRTAIPDARGGSLRRSPKPQGSGLHRGDRGRRGRRSRRPSKLRNAALRVFSRLRKRLPQGAHVSPRSRPAADAWRVAAVDASNLRLAARNGGRRIPWLEHHSSASCRPLRMGEGAGSPFSPACAEKVRMRGREIIRGGQSPGPLTPALSPQAGRGGFRATRNFTLRQLPYGRGASCRRQ